MRPQCVFCHLRTVESLICKFRPESSVAERFVQDSLRLLVENPETSNPVVACRLHRLARAALRVNDLYAAEKHAANQLLLDRYPFWQRLVHENESPSRVAVRLAVLGNVVDYGAHTVSDDLLGQVQSLLDQPLAVDDTPELLEEAAHACSILYLADNAGELVFDRLFIETLGGANVTVVVRGASVINDATIDDAIEVGLDQVCRVIGNGSDAPSTIIEECSEEFQRAYSDADLVIAKGQGNLEGLIHERRPGLFFLLMAKCEPISELTGVNPGDMLVASASRFRAAS